VRTGKAAQSHTLEAVVNLQVGKAHLDAFTLVARYAVRLCPHQPARDVAGIFMNIAGDFARWRLALRLNQRPRKTLGFEKPSDRLQAVLH